MQSSRQSSKYLVVLIIATLVLMPLTLMLIVESLFVVQGSLLIYELLLLLLLSIFIRPVFNTVFYLLLIAVMLIFSVAPAYHLAFNSLLSWAKEISLFPISFFVVLSLSFFTLVVISSISFGYVRNRASFVSLCSIIIPCVIIAVVMDRIVEPRIGRNLVSSATKSLLQISQSENTNKGYHYLDTPESFATSDLFVHLSESKRVPSKILLVVVESMGFGSPEINNLQYKHLIERELDQSRYDIKYSSIPFKGSTVPGELRELCGISTSTVVPFIDKAQADKCLPNLLKNKGYETSAYHGYTGGFFNRVEWYNGLGFDSINFANRLLSTHDIHDRCGYLLFEGLCDSDIAMILRDKISSRSRPQFVYWLTLNGHQPTPDKPKKGKYLECSEMKISSDRRCWSVQHTQVVINALMSVIKSIPDLGMIVVGDHSPGGFGMGMSDAVVPAIVIWPNEES